MALFYCENCNSEVEEEEAASCTVCGCVLCPDCICEQCENESEE
jgi:hypothetical protein